MRLTKEQLHDKLQRNKQISIDIKASILSRPTRDSGPAAVMEPASGDEPLAEAQIQETDVITKCDPNPVLLWEKYQDTGSVHRTSVFFNVCGETVRQHLRNNGYHLDREQWTAAELEQLTSLYRDTPDSEFSISDFARKLGRTFSAVALKASRLGLSGDRKDTYVASISARKHSSEAQIKRAAEHPEDSIAKSKRHKEWLSNNPHPKGFKGGHHSDESKKRIGDAARKTWADPNHFINSKEYRGCASLRNSKLASVRTSENTFSRCKRGVRADIPGVFFRSSWEANYARYLNFLISRSAGITEWQYEPQTFWFESIQRGCRSYRPDFRVTLADGTIEYHEVKGWMYPRSRTALRRMRKYHPEVRMVLIDQARYRAISKQFRKIIQEWE